MKYLILLQNLRFASAGIFDAFMLKTSELAQGLFTFMLLALVYWCVDKRMGQLIAFNTSFACWLNQWAKLLFKIDRPWVRDPAITPVEEALTGAGGYSFPSGHVARATATYGPVGYLSVKRERGHRVLGILAGCLIALVAFSRNYLGVHTFADVAVSLVVGVGILFATDLLLKWVDAASEPGSGLASKRDIILWAVSCIIIFLPMLKFGCLSNAGASYGLLTGWLLERRFVRFKTDGRLSVRILRFAIGAGVLFFLYTSGTSVMAWIVPDKYASFFLQGFAAFFIMFLWPAVFHVWESPDIEEGRRRLCKKWICMALAAVLALGAIVAAVKVVSNYNAAREWETSVSQDGMQGSDSLLGEAGFVPAYADNIPTRAYENDIRVIAHRGYSGVAPENTLAAFRRAMDIGADMIELDVQLTSDGEIVLFHDDDMARITGVSGRIGDYTLDEIRAMDAGGEKIPTLTEALELITGSDLEVYLELKDISDVESLSDEMRGAFPGMVYDAVTAAGMQDRVVYASFAYDYMAAIKDAHPEARILCNTSEPDAEVLLRDCPSDYYGVNASVLTSEEVSALHGAGTTVYVWTVNTPADVRRMTALGVDGVVTNYPGMAKVAVHDEYSFISDNCVRTLTMPGLYDYGVQSVCAGYVCQGLTVVGRDRVIVSAYDKSGTGNSILYVMDHDGRLLNVVDLGFKAHTGGIAYDAANSLLWVTHADGHVCALSYSDLMDGRYSAAVAAGGATDPGTAGSTGSVYAVYFDAGLTNDGGGHVASFLTVDEGKLYVGSYCNETDGELHEYEIDELIAGAEAEAGDEDAGDAGSASWTPEPDAVYEIPEHIQGITFDTDNGIGTRRMLLSQGHEMDDSALLMFEMGTDPGDGGSAEAGGILSYLEPDASYTLPEGAEQIQYTSEGLWILFESSARPYRATSRIPNDQIWCLEAVSIR